MTNVFNYQTEYINEVLETFKTKQSVILQMPTGTGKTIVFCEIAKHFYNKKRGRVLILAHRTELINQIKEKLEKTGLKFGIIQSNQEIEIDRQIQIASIQTLSRRNKISFIKNVDLIIIDEAHHTPSNTYKKILKTYQVSNTKLLGVTATPLRLDGKGFENIFDKLISSHSFKWFVENEYLSPVKHFASDKINLKIGEMGISTKKGLDGFEEYDILQSEKYFNDEKVMADLIEGYKKWGENKKAIVFAVSINHAKEIAERYNKNGYSAIAISSKTEEKERKSSIEKFTNGKFKILVNVDLFTEGFDCPNIEVVQLARPTKSLVKYLQMVGRVTRKAPNKCYAIILDHACLWHEHGLVTEERSWSLEGCKTQQTEHDYTELQITNGTCGNDAARKLKESLELDLIEIHTKSEYKPEHSKKIVFTNRRLLNVLTEFKVSKNQFYSDLEKCTFDLLSHLSGSAKDPINRYVSENLLFFIDQKYCSNKGINGIVLPNY